MILFTDSLCTSVGACSASSQLVLVAPSIQPNPFEPDLTSSPPKLQQHSVKLYQNVQNQRLLAAGGLVSLLHRLPSGVNSLCHCFPPLASCQERQRLSSAAV